MAPTRIDPNKHLETTLESNVCMVDCRWHLVLDLTFQPRFLLYGLQQQGCQCFLTIVLWALAAVSSKVTLDLNVVCCLDRWCHVIKQPWEDVFLWNLWGMLVSQKESFYL
jgi:hypothetical protein